MCCGQPHRTYIHTVCAGFRCRLWFEPHPSPTLIDREYSALSGKHIAICVVGGERGGRFQDGGVYGGVLDDWSVDVSLNAPDPPCCAVLCCASPPPPNTTPAPSAPHCRFGSFEVAKPPDPQTGRAGPSAGQAGQLLLPLVGYVIRHHHSDIWAYYGGGADVSMAGMAGSQVSVCVC